MKWTCFDHGLTIGHVNTLTGGVTTVDLGDHTKRLIVDRSHAGKAHVTCVANGRSLEVKEFGCYRDAIGAVPMMLGLLEAM